jgi:serine/threonine protein kinase
MDHFKPFTVGSYVCKGGKESLLGRGSFADVYKGFNQLNGESDKVAIKVIDIGRLTRGNEKLKQHLDSEIQIMKTLQHEYIVKLFDVYTVSYCFFPFYDLES